MPNILNELLELFFPRLCTVCKEPLIQDEEQICLNCLYGLPRSHYEDDPDNLVAQLFADKGFVANATSLFLYDKGGKIQKIVHAFKYHANREMAFRMGREMALALQAYPAYRDSDMIVPVPLHKKRKRERGYNQTEWIAKGIASVWNIPILTDILIRTSATDSQTRKSFYDRWQNVKEMFVLNANAAAPEGKQILLVDDVVTSGSTLSACAEAFAPIPGIRLNILTLAATYH